MNRPVLAYWEVTALAVLGEDGQTGRILKLDSECRFERFWPVYREEAEQEIRFRWLVDELMWEEHPGRFTGNGGYEPGAVLRVESST